MKGKIALHGYKQKSAYNLRVVKPKRRKVIKFCLECGRKLLYEHGNALRCGNERKKIGCAYKAYRQRNKVWKKETKYHLKRDKKKMRQYNKNYYGRIIRLT